MFLLWATISATGQTLTAIEGTASVSTGRDFNGWIDGLRLTKGVARYDAAFTPPTKEFPTL